MTIVEELKGYMYNIESFSRDMGQDAQALHEYLIDLTNYMARANKIMADYQRKVRDDKRQAYALLIKEYGEKKYFAPSLAKDYVDAKCSASGYVYDLAERLSRLCTHTIDAIRTIISSLKSEREFSKYN